MVFTTPLVAALRRAYPGARLSYVVESAAAAVLDGNPHLNDLIVIPRRRGAARLADDLRLVRRLRQMRVDTAIDLHGGPRSAWLTRASGAPVRIGYALPGRAWMYTHTVPRAAEPSVRHSVLNQWDLLTPLGIPTPTDAAGTAVEMYEPPSARLAVAGMLASFGVGPSQPLIVVHVSASNPFKRWPAASFADTIVQLLHRDPDRVAFVVSGPSEPGAADDVVSRASVGLGPGRPRVFAPQLALPELRALISRAAVYIGGDSGPLHVASTTTTPIVELLGPTVASRSFPWRPARVFTAVLDAGPLPCRPCRERTCGPGDFRCLTRIPPAQVVAAAEQALASRATE